MEIKMLFEKKLLKKFTLPIIKKILKFLFKLTVFVSFISYLDVTNSKDSTEAVQMRKAIIFTSFHIIQFLLYFRRKRKKLCCIYNVT